MRASNSVGPVCPIRSEGDIPRIVTTSVLSKRTLGDLPPETRSRKNVRNWAIGRGYGWQGGSITPEQVIKKLRQAEVAMAEGGTVAQASRKIGVTEQTFYRWRAEYGSLRIDQARRLKQLETENGRLRRAVADLTLDNQLLKEAAQGNF